MPFVKTGVGVSSAILVGDFHPDPQIPEFGQERDGEVWDGKSWVSKEEEELESRPDERAKE